MAEPTKKERSVVVLALVIGAAVSFGVATSSWAVGAGVVCAFFALDAMWGMFNA